MFPKYLLCFALIAFTSTGAIPRRLNPQCRSNACDDRPQCPRTSCRCLFPSRMDCAVYYQCINGKPFQYRCSPGLLFNNETLTCDYSYNVKCDMSATSSPVSTGADNTTSIGYVTTTEIPDESTTVDVTEKGVNKQTVTNKVTESKTSPVSSKTFQTDATYKESSSSSEETDAPTMSESTPESTTVEITQKQTSDSVTIDTEKESTAFETTLEISTSPADSETTTELTEDTTSNKITSETAREPTSTQTTVDLHTSTSKSIITDEASTIAELTEIPTTIVSATTTVETNDRSTAFISTTLLDLITTTQSPSTKIDKIVTNSTFGTTKNDIITSTESPTSEFLCPSRFGLYADPKSCKRFYHCSHWKPYHKWCPSDLHFNPKLRVCDWPYRAGCEFLCPSRFGLYADPKSCKRFYHCSHWKPYHKWCPSDLHFNPKLRVCDWPYRAGCEFLCPSRFGLYADPKSCKRFYHCSHWKPYHKWCPSDLHFNPKLRVCDWPYRAGCDVILPSSVPDNTPTPMDQNDGNVTCDCDMCELPVLDECTAYILCMNKVGDKIYCSPGLYFNRMTGTCDLPENVECLEDNYDCSESSGRYLLEGSCSYFVECRNGEKSVKTCPEGLQFNRSSEMCSWLGSCAGLPDKLPTSKTTADLAICNGCSYCFKPVMSDCTRYVRCSQGVASEERCPPGLFFNSDTEMCDHSYNVQCPDPEPNPECPERFGYFPYPGECGKYLQCVNGSASVKTCPGVLHFDPVKKHCDYPWAAGCNDSNSRPTPEPSQGIAECDCDCCLKPVGTDCRNFTICINRVSFTGSCSSGLLFNPHTENCDFAENVDCAVPPEIPTYSCPEYQGLFPHPEDCRKFIHCAHGFPYIKDCPANLHFNPKLKVCDWPYSAGCQADPTNDPTIEDGDDHNLPCDICDSCFIPDESDCASYMYCQNGTGHRLRCTGNLLFNPNSETCDLASNVKCPNQPTSNCPKPDGLFAAKDCSQFIHCSHGIAYLKDCPDGLHFNAQILVCDWPENVKCGEVPIQPTLPPTDDDGDNDASNRSCNCDCCFLPHDKDCSKYILCLDGLMHFGQCSRGLLFNPSIQNCDLAERVTCGGISSLCLEPNGLFQNKVQCSSYIKCLDGNANVEYCPNGMHFSANQRQCLDPCKAQCDPTYNCEPSSSTTPQIPSSTLSPFCPEMDGLFPNTEDCSSFYQCSNGRAFLVQCPSSLHFDKKYEICDYPCNAKCNASIDCDSPSTTPSTTSHIPASTLSPFCPEMDGLFPNIEDCSSLYLCSAGKASLLECPPGLHFDEKHKICDYPCNVKCNTSIDCEPSSSTTPQIPSSTLSPFCPEMDGLFPNTEDCSSFYQCSNGRAFLVQCPSSLHFDKKYEICDYPCNAKCNASIDCESSSSISSTSPIPSSTTLSSFCPENYGLFPNRDNCSSFYCSSADKAFLVQCPPGLHFDEKHKVCDYPCNAKCNTSIDCVTSSSVSYTTSTLSTTQSPYCPEKDGLFPNIDDCSLFYQCSEGKAYTVTCPAGLHFSDEHKVCEYPCEAKCNTTINCASSSSTSTTTATTSTSRSTSTPSSFCPERNGLFPNVENCASFYQCSEGKAHLVECPSGLHFSDEHKICEYPCNAKCDSTLDCSPVTLKPTSSGGSANCPLPNGLNPVEGDCTAFYLCSNSKDYLIPCPPGLHFSVKLETCEKPCIAECNTSLSCGTKMEPTSSTPHPLSPECKEPDGLFENPEDCGSFYQCSGGRSNLIRCPNGLHFSLEDSACEKPCVAGCDLSIECPREIPETKDNCTCNGCYFPDPTDCSAFYYCDDGQLSKSYCPFGTLFSKTSSICEDENTVDCENNGDPGMCPEPYGFFPYQGDCKKFIHCDNSIAHIKQCQGDLEYDPQHRVCTYPKGYCGEIDSDPNCPEPTGMFPDSKNCSLFYHCEHGVAYPKRCSPPLMFNPEIKVCDWPNNVDCGKENASSTSPAPTPTPKPTPTTPATDNITISSSLSTIASTPSTSECHEVPGVICPCACRVPTYDECSSYFQCQEDGTACKKFCPEGLYFNKREMVCDLPENVECRDFFFSSIRRAKQFSHRFTP